MQSGVYCAGCVETAGRQSCSSNLARFFLPILTVHDQIIETELEGFGIRLNKQPPAITVRKKDRGGIAISHTVPLTHIEPEEIKAVLSEYKISNADVNIRCDATLDEFIDVVEGGRIYMPALYVLNKIGQSVSHQSCRFVLMSRISV